MFKSLPSVAVICISWLALGWGLAVTPLTAQDLDKPPYYLARSHAHNDYEHPHPLSDSLSLGFASIEVDVWLVDDALCVAHDRADIDPNRQLGNLYLDPLLEHFTRNHGKVFAEDETLILLIDFKSEGEATYQKLKQLLPKYRSLLEVTDEKKKPAVRIIVSGNRPIEMIEADSERLVSIDGRLKDLQSEIDAKLTPWISDNWRLHFRFSGEGEMSQAERTKLQNYVKQVHQNGAQLRFWGTPENESLWALLREEKVDFIGTDQLERLADFLR